MFLEKKIEENLAKGKRKHWCLCQEFVLVSAVMSRAPPRVPVSSMSSGCWSSFVTGTNVRRNGQCEKKCVFEWETANINLSLFMTAEDWQSLSNRRQGAHGLAVWEACERLFWNGFRLALPAFLLILFSRRDTSSFTCQYEHLTLFFRLVTWATIFLGSHSDRSFVFPPC